MKKIRSKIGTIYVEKYNKRKLEEFIDVYDSDKKFLNSYSTEILETKKDYNKIIKAISKMKTKKEFDNLFMLKYEFIGDKKDLIEYLQEHCKLTKEEANTDVELKTRNEMINRIGKTYILVNE